MKTTARILFLLFALAGLTTGHAQTPLMLGEHHAQLRLQQNGRYVLLPEACEVVVDVKGSADIILSNTKGEQVVMHYDQPCLPL